MDRDRQVGTPRPASSAAESQRLEPPGDSGDEQEQWQRLRDIPSTNLSTHAGAHGSHPLSRGLQLALCVTALLWAGAALVIAQKAARGLAERFQAGLVESFLASLFLLFLAVAGLRTLDWIATRGRYTAEVLPLPARPTARAEFGTGAAIGWALALAAVLPLLLSGNLHGRILWQPGSPVAILLALGTLLAASLAEEVVFRGYLYRRLGDATGPAWSALILSILFGVALVASHRPPNLLTALVDCTLFGLILTIAYQRTHALWLGWGLHFAYRAVTAVLLGLPIAGHVEYGSIADVLSSGPRWLTGGAFGLDAAIPTAFFLLAGIAVLYRVSRDYAWHYTHPPIVPGGYEVAVAPPKAHVEMEAAAAPPTLVQILPAAPPPTPREDPGE
jgi:membrane protease YdiL (CAAX protease family)